MSVAEHNERIYFCNTLYSGEADPLLVRPLRHAATERKSSRSAGQAGIPQVRRKLTPIASITLTRELDFTMPGAIKLINRFIDLDILSAPNENIKYGKTYVYDAYLRILNE